MTDTKDPHAELMALADEFAASFLVASAARLHSGGDSVAAQDAQGAFNTSRDALVELARTLTDRIAELERMFLAACSDLGAINKALGLDPDDGGAEPILDAIKELEARLEAVGAGGVGSMVPNEVESRELILQHAVMDSVQLMNGCVITSPTLQKAHELLRQSLWDYSEAVSGTRKATDHNTLLVRALRSLEDTEKCHGSTTRRTVLMADIRSATIASAQPAPAVVGSIPQHRIAE